MTDFLTMTPDQARDEAARRDDRRRRGLPLTETPAEREERIQEEDARLEKEIQAECRRIYIAFGCKVYWMSQARETKQSAGPGDLIVFHRRKRVAWWHETKTPTGEQRAAQKEFEADCNACTWEYVLGGILAAEEQLIKIGVGYRLSDGSLEPRR